MTLGLKDSGLNLEPGPCSGEALGSCTSHCFQGESLPLQCRRSGLAPCRGVSASGPLLTPLSVISPLPPRTGAFKPGQRVHLGPACASTGHRVVRQWPVLLLGERLAQARLQTNSSLENVLTSTAAPIRHCCFVCVKEAGRGG